MNEKIDQIIIVIKCYQKIVSELLLNWNTEKLKHEENLIFYHLLERHLYNVSAIRVQLAELKQLQGFKLPVNILMRVALLDSLTLIHLAISKKSSPEKLLSEIARLDQTIAKSLYEGFVEELKSKKISKEEFDSELKKLKSYFPNNFSTKSNSKISIINKSPLKTINIWKELKGTPFEFYKDCYELYKYYSSFEHFSRTTLRVFRSTDLDKELKNIAFGLFYILHSSYVSSSILKMNPLLVEKLKEIPPILLDLEF